MAISPEGPGYALYITTIILVVLSWITIGLRTATRLKIKGFGLDDWLMWLGLVFFTIAASCVTVGTVNGVGARSERLNPYYEAQGRKWFMFSQLFYVASTVPIKASICTALLRITTHRRYRYPLYAVVVLALLAAITTDITVLAQCRPVAATWDRSLGKCADPSVIIGVSYFISAVSIVTDWTCATLPAFILWDVQLRLRVKVSIIIVLALGIVASTATLVRLRYLLQYSNPEDYLYGVANVALWSVIESGIGIIAGSLATLRPLLKYLYIFTGSSMGSTHTGTGGASKRRTNLELGTLSAPKMSTRCEGNKKNWEELSDGGSQKFILKESQVEVTLDQVSMAGRSEHRSETDL